MEKYISTLINNDNSLFLGVVEASSLLEANKIVNELIESTKKYKNEGKIVIKNIKDVKPIKYKSYKVSYKDYYGNSKTKIMKIIDNSENTRQLIEKVLNDMSFPYRIGLILAL